MMSLSKATLECRKLYETKFDPVAYLRFLTVETHGPAEKSEAFFNKFTYKAFKDEKATGSRCVDIAAGPTIHRLAIASKFCEVLYSSDYLRANRDTVKRFMNVTTLHSAQEILIKKVAALEGFKNLDEGVQTITKRLRSKLKNAVPCDVLKEQPLGDLQLIGGPFDVAISNGCLETACTSINEYKNSLKNLSNLLKRGGALLLMTYLDEDYYMINDVSYPCIRLFPDTVTNCLKWAGFEVVTVETSKGGVGGMIEYSNCNGFLFVNATKV